MTKTLAQVVDGSILSGAGDREAQAHATAAAVMEWVVAWLKTKEGGLRFPKMEQQAHEAGLLPQEAQDG